MGGATSAAVPWLRANCPSAVTAAASVATAGPGGPCGPVAPVWPRSDRRAPVEMSLSATERSRMSRERTAPVRSSDAPTAPVRICLEPTLFLGSWVTAYEVPPSAMKTATVAITLA